jgi:hypothetical protein
MNGRLESSDDLFWGTKVIRRQVDPVTFAFREDVVGIPRIEETSYETMDLAASQKRLLKMRQPDKRSDFSIADAVITLSPTISPEKERSDFHHGRRPSTPSADPQRRSVSMPAVNVSSPKKKSSRSKSPKVNQSSKSGSSRTKSPVKTKPSARPNKEPSVKRKGKTSSDTTLGAFLQRNTAQHMFQQEAKRVLGGMFDSRSVGSGRSMASMSVSDRSLAERSKAEKALAQCAKQRKAARDRRSAAGGLPDSIDEMSVSDFSRVSNLVGGTGDEIFNGSPCKSPNRGMVSVGSASTLGPKSISSQRRSEKLLENERKMKVEDVLQEEDRKEDESPVESVQEPKLDVAAKKSGSNEMKELTSILRKESLEESLNLEDVVVVREKKNLRFRDGHSEKHISQELTHSMYDDLFWTSEELAEFRYEAFMEEAGLDINEFC